MGASLKTRAVNVLDLDMGNTKFSIAQSQLVQSPGNQTVILGVIKKSSV